MRTPRCLALASTLVALALGAPLAAAKDKEKDKPVVAKPGIYQIPAPAPFKYIQMGVPKDYDAKKWYPLLFMLHPVSDNAATSIPDTFHAIWSEALLDKGWIVAAPATLEWDNETSIDPIRASLKRVMETYHVDDRRVVLCGHNAGALMAWRVATREPKPWAAILALSGEIHQSDRGSALKGLAGKTAYIFRGEKDTSYTLPMMEMDRKNLEAFKVTVTTEVKPAWTYDFPRTSLPAMTAWIEGVWPPGAYRERATEAEKALAAKDFAAAGPALAALQVELKKSPYPAFEAKAADLGQAFVDAGRAAILEAKAALDADPLDALARMEALSKAFKGAKPLEAEAAAALAALRKDPKTVQAVRTKEAEAQAATYMGKAEALEAKGDLAKALDWYRKAAALGETSKKADADRKIQDLEPKVAGK